MKTIVVTGGCGFIGSNYISMLLAERKDYQIINVDNLTYASNIYNLRDYWEDPRLIFSKADISKGKEIADKPESLISFVKERAGHDFRYAINFSKATRELGWKPRMKFEKGLADTEYWYMTNKAWIDILSGKYQEQNEKYLGFGTV